MSTSSHKDGSGIYAAFEAAYREAGYAPVPVGNDKAPLGKGWNKWPPTEAEFAERLRRYPNANIGLLAGTPLSTGNTLAFIDVDEPGLVRFVCEACGPMTSAKVGKKGKTIIAQATPKLKSFKILRPDTGKPAVEFMVSSGMVVIPPSKHPDGIDYGWRGRPLLDLDPADLPVLTTERITLVRTVLRHPNAWAIIAGGAEVKAHQLMLQLTSSGLAGVTQDLDWLERCLGALFHEDYSGNTKNKIGEMLRSAVAKGLGGHSFAPRPYDPGEDGPVPLGFTRDGLYVLLDRVRQILVLCSSNQLLSEYYMVGLAPTSFWGHQFPTQKGVNWKAAGESLIAACRARGPFIPTRVRGRGIWREDDRTIVNLGGPVDSTKHLYLCFEAIKLDPDANFDAARLLELLRTFRWRNQQDATLLLGWLAIAPICGVLTWRPHCFVYGPPRSGKTTLHSIARTLLDPLVISADGQSSEAGIRQTLGPDSLPVMLDEFESDQNATGLRQVLRLARSASSADTPVLKGTPEGKAMTFSLRTAFFFAAVNPRGMSVADQSRIMMFELLMHDNDSAKARAIALEERHFRSLGPAWCSYMVSLADKIHPAIDRLEPLIVSTDRRHRQNISTLLGGAFVALHGRVPTPEEATAFAAEFSTTVARHDEENERDDALECLNHLLNHPHEGFPLGHWIAVEQQRLSGLENTRGNSRKVIAMNGMRIELEGDLQGLLIQNSSSAMERVFKDTHWAAQAWKRALRKLEGSFVPPNPVQFFSGKTRCIGIPLHLLPDTPLEEPDRERSSGGDGPPY